MFARSQNAVNAVEDGSTDNTLRHIESTGCPCVRFATNRGKGAALHAGIAEVLKRSDGLLSRDFDYILTLEGDGQHDVGAVRRLLDTAEREKADLVLGIRDLRAMPARSRIGNFTSRILFWLGHQRRGQRCPVLDDAECASR